MITKGDLERHSTYTTSRWGHYQTRNAALVESSQRRIGCLGNFFGNRLYHNTSYKGTSWAALFLGRALWEYREPYVKEIINLFQNILPGEIELITYDDKRKSPRVIYPIEYEEYKEPIHCFNVFLRYSWERLHHWPVQDTPPDAKTMWAAHLERIGWDTEPFRNIGYIDHSNFCCPTLRSRLLKMTAADYIDGVYDILLDRMDGFPFRSRVPSSGDPLMKASLFKMALTRFEKKVGNVIDDYDPFEEIR